MNKSYFYLDMKTHELQVPYTHQMRRVRVLLPKNYEEDTDISYPVVYFHDGQNVFHSREAFSGHSWKIIPTIKKQIDSFLTYIFQSNHFVFFHKNHHLHKCANDLI